MIGSLALQGINGVRIVVISLSSWFSIILAPIIPGTEHPEPTINGIKLLPLKPIRLNTLSRNKDILDMYPVVSSMHIQVNNIINWGTNPKTAPTPAIIPSTIKDTNQGDVPIFANHSSVIPPKDSNHPAIKSTVNDPTTPTDRK